MGSWLGWCRFSPPCLHRPLRTLFCSNNYWSFLSLFSMSFWLVLPISWSIILPLFMMKIFGRLITPMREASPGDLETSIFINEMSMFPPAIFSKIGVTILQAAHHGALNRTRPFSFSFKNSLNSLSLNSLKLDTPLLSSPTWRRGSPPKHASAISG